MSIINTIFGGGAANLVGKVGDVVDNLTTTKEEKEAAKAEMMRIITDDIQSARDMEARTQESQFGSILSKNIAPVLAVFVVVLTFAMFFVLLFKTIDEARKEVFIYLLGVLSASLTQVLGFYFGSSHGSKEKDKIINKK